MAAALIVIGVVGYVATDRQSATALIPAFLGLLLLAFGWLARNEAYRKHAMHAVAAFALLGLLGTIGGLIRLLGGTTTPAAISQGCANGNPDRHAPGALCQVLHRRTKTEGARMTCDGTWSGPSSGRA